MKKTIKKLPAKQLKKECRFHKIIHIRDNFGEGFFDDSPYSLEVECETHYANWICLVKTIEEALVIAGNFPLVWGGLRTTKDARLPDQDCILTHIPSPGRKP